MRTGQHNFSSTPALLELNLFLFHRPAKAAPCTPCEPAPSRVLEISPAGARSRGGGRTARGRYEMVARRGCSARAAFPPQHPATLSSPHRGSRGWEPAGPHVRPTGPASRRCPPSARARSRPGSAPRGAPQPFPRPPGTGTPRPEKRLPGTRRAGAGGREARRRGPHSPGSEEHKPPPLPPLLAVRGRRAQAQGRGGGGGLRPAPQGRSGGGMAASRPSGRTSERMTSRA